ncbi:galactosyltransferase-related protein [Sphingobium lactosutens]|uniref:Glycosyl transferase n=1 Tax=Sphingobium lactosutens DS20 TaxID=1331060 RepID=T0H8L8_9SPHN|nr:galactosyltransferase-related protein [Sphingobium lactosutens]EQB12701.1 glycosyl transferase [Sphingobium lactosutens DS20]
MNKVSVITLARGRGDHLVNVVHGLNRQSMLPVELIIAVMQNEPYSLPKTPFPVRQIHVAGDDLPLAAARNAAAAVATGDILIFLDIDCIPSPSLVADYAAHADRFDGLLMGEVLYLPHQATQGDWSCEGFEGIAEKHSDRRGPPAHGIEICADYRCFWSLNFAMQAQTFRRSGGFDERYVGYGGEDTDYGKTLSTAGIAIAWAKGARAYHQYHPHHMPPVHHVESVVRNAQLFEAKWGYRTMGHWLHAFRLMGLIDDAPGLPIRLLRAPDQDDLALTGQQSHQPYANTATVLRLLESRQKRGADMMPIAVAAA